MEQLKQRILEDGVVKPGNVLKVDSFLNHQIDIVFLNEVGAEFARRFADTSVNKILTIEASGIGIAAITALHFGNAPVVFAKKSKTLNLDGDLYHARVESFTHKTVNDVVVSKKFLSPDDHVLVIDDFLANGCALQGLIEIIRQAGATLVGCGIVIEKGFQHGGDHLREQGIRVESLAIIESMSNDTLTFRN